jgi:hypothetical protein
VFAHKEKASICGYSGELLNESCCSEVDVVLCDITEYMLWRLFGNRICSRINSDVGLLNQCYAENVVRTI